MERETVIKKAMRVLRSNQIDSIKKELQDYIKTDAKEIFDTGDVSISGRVIWDKHKEEYELDDMEIESATIKGFAHYLLHDLYKDIPEKEQRTSDAEELQKEFIGKSFPFKTKLKDQELSGEIKVLETKYNPAKDEVVITKNKLENIQVS